MTGDLPGFVAPLWRQVGRGDHDGRALADRHYSRQTIGSVGWSPPGEHFALVREGAVWCAVRGFEPGRSETMRWRVTIFRRESGPRASDLIRAATEATFSHWTRRGTFDAPPKRSRRKSTPRRPTRSASPGGAFSRPVGRGSARATGS